MAAITPFRALRPTPEAAARVASVPYDVVSADEARTMAAGNALSFLHVSRAEIDMPAGTDPYAREVYDRAVANFEELKATAPLVVEDEPAMYVYQLQMGGHVQRGIAACYAVADYERNVIRKHEHTRRDKEDDRTRHILALRAQTGPVFLLHRPSQRTTAVVERVTGGPPLVDVAAEDGIRHTIWRIDSAGQQELTAAFAAMPALYIADGHHRAASAARVAQQLRPNGPGPAEWFLAVSFPSDEVQVLPYNRIVRDLGGHTPGSLLAEISKHFPVREGPPAPVRKGEVSVLLDGGWHTVELPVPREGLTASDGLDVTRLQDLILTPLLGIRDVRVDKRIDFVGGIRGTRELEALVASGRAAVAFSMYPVSVDDLMTVSDAGGIMPPKSTWFEPKLRDGLLSHLI